MMFVLLGLWYEIGTSNINTKPLKLRSFGFVFWVYFMRSNLFLFFSFFTFAFFFSFKFGFMCGRYVGSCSDIVPIVWVLFCFLQTKNWVQVWLPNKNFSEIKEKRELWIELRIVSCELWECELSYENWDMDVLRTEHYINFQIFDHTWICPIWALNQSFFYCNYLVHIIIRSDCVEHILGMWPKHSINCLIKLREHVKLPQHPHCQSIKT